MQRRQFLLFTGLGASAAVLCGHLSRRSASVPGVAELPAEPLQVVQRTARALGSEVSITVLHEHAENARAALDAAFGELELVERLMSIYRPESQLSQLNRDGRVVDPHPYFLAVLRHAEATSQATGGAFDISVQPLWQLFADSRAADRLPSDGEIEAARRNVDWRRVQIDDNRIRLTRAGMAITLNGIAQGFAADRVMAALAEHGVRHALVNTGEISTRGRGQHGSAWTIGIQHPRRMDAFISLAELSGRCLATSGDYATSFTDDHRWNHIFDPRTGRSPGDLSSVSVVAPTALQADALSTAALVLGAERALPLLARQDGVDAMFVDKQGTVRCTTGFPVRTVG